MRFRLVVACAAASLGLASLALGCSGSKSGSGFDNGTGADGGAGGGGGGGLDEAGVFGGGDSSKPPACVPDPGNFEIPNNNCDDDGDGVVDNVVVCDKTLPMNAGAPDFARSMGLCNTASGANDPKWGVISATYTKGHNAAGAPADGQHGILAKFGGVIKPREGSALGVLSSGWAREFDDVNGATAIFQGGVDMQQSAVATAGGAPPGFPKHAQGCPIKSDVYDVITVKLQIKVPKNAQGLTFDFDFWSGEWPEYVCTDFNDGFVAWLQSKALNGGAADNISFDANKNPVSVNNGFFDRCTPNTQTGCSGLTPILKTATCPGGTSELQGTGFLAQDVYCTTTSSGGGATGWLTTTAPVAPGEVISLEFLIWDTGDANFDSSVLLDNFQWVPGPVQTGTQRPPK